jgi:predicted restriction endonuclease
MKQRRPALFPPEQRNRNAFAVLLASLKISSALGKTVQSDRGQSRGATFESLARRFSKTNIASSKSDGLQSSNSMRIENKGAFVAYINSLPIANSTKQTYRNWVDRIEATRIKRLTCAAVRSEDKIKHLAEKITKRGFTSAHTKDIRLSLRYYAKFCGTNGSLDVEAEQARAEAEGVFSPQNGRQARKRILRSIALRRGQQAFRQRLLRAYSSQCCVTGTATTAVLEAAHIQPYANLGTNLTSNGLLLRSDIHVLFDLRKVSINPATGLVYCCCEIRSVAAYRGLHGRPIRMPRTLRQQPNFRALAEHYQMTIRGVAS